MVIEWILMFAAVHLWMAATQTHLHITIMTRRETLTISLLIGLALLSFFLFFWLISYGVDL